MPIDQNRWFTEAYQDKTAVSVQFEKVLFDQKSEFQRVQIFQTEPMGNVLILNGCFMVTDKDAFAYHEMLSHPAMTVCPTARRVLVIGGGDAGAITEIAKYPQVESMTLCEIDPLVVDVCRQYFPDVSAGLNDPRLTIVHEDGAEFIKKETEGFDIILIDSTDPVGPAEALYEVPFFRSVLAALRSGGVAVFQTESPFSMPEILSDTVGKLKSVFGEESVFTYLGIVPCYPGAMWSFSLCTRDSVTPDMIEKAPDQSAVPPGLKYYSPEVHNAAFALPPFVRSLT